MVDAPETEYARLAKLIDEGIPQATQAAVQRLGGAEQVEAEYYRVAAKLDAAMNGEPSDVAAIVLHSALVNIFRKCVEPERVH